MEYYTDCRCGCGEFTAKRINQAFKTKQCRRSYYNAQRQARRVILLLKNCEICSIQFQPVRYDQKYCESCKGTHINHIVANIPVAKLDSTYSGIVLVQIKNGKVISIASA